MDVETHQMRRSSSTTRRRVPSGKHSLYIQLFALLASFHSLYLRLVIIEYYISMCRAFPVSTQLTNAKLWNFFWCFKLRHFTLLSKVTFISWELSCSPPHILCHIDRTNGCANCTWNRLYCSSSTRSKNINTGCQSN